MGRGKPPRPGHAADGIRRRESELFYSMHPVAPTACVAPALILRLPVTPAEGKPGPILLTDGVGPGLDMPERIIWVNAGCSIALSD